MLRPYTLFYLHRDYCLNPNSNSVHALGFYHEHMRPDRDDYVTINENNIKAAMIHNFKKGDYKTYDFYDFNRYVL